MKWYIINTVAGHENKVVKAIAEDAAKRGLSHFFGDVIVPSHNVLEVRRGKKVSSEKKFFPGYVFIKMDLNNQSWNRVKNVSSVGKFLGQANSPMEISEAEIKSVLSKMEDDVAVVDSTESFDVGEMVKIIDGPFESFVGLIEEVDNEKKRIRVLVSIFSRETPVELEFNQVQKSVE